MAVTTDEIKKLRDETGISVMECKRALEDADGDSKKALILLRKKGSAAAAKKADRALAAGVVHAYIHNTRQVGVLVELACETDFVAKNGEFVALAYDLAMHIAALAPMALSRENINEDEINRVRETLSKEVEGKDESMKDKILEGKVDAYFKDKVLLEQTYIKDASLTVRDLISNAVQKFGEKIEVTRFVRFGVNES